VQETLYTANKWKTKSNTSLLIHRQFYASLVLETNFSLLIAAGSAKFALSGVVLGFATISFGGVYPKVGHFVVICLFGYTT
jgi:hypothetical protein